MGRKATKAAGNVWFEARKNAAKVNERLESRLGAAEELGVSEDVVKSAELELYKAMPVDVAVLMADTYGAPQLKNYYCLHECPIGKSNPISADVLPIERATIKLIRQLNDENLEPLKDKLLEIAEDGEISEEELPELEAVMKALRKLSRTVSELKIIGDTALKGRK